MQGSYIRELSINYRDPIEKIISGDEVPKKFLDRRSKILMQEDDDYKKKRLITIIHSPNQNVRTNHKQQSCLTKLFACFIVDLCPQCEEGLCLQCRQSKFLKISMCDICRKQLCPTCKRVLQGKKIKLRNYRIKLKNIKELHFKDCECFDCKTQKSHR